MLRRANGGFTLIELLVVIAIIAILAAILFPVFARARSKGYQASCASNLKQIATAIIMYGDDHDGYGPLSHGMGCFEDVEKGDVLPGARCNAALALAAYDGGWADYWYLRKTEDRLHELRSQWNGDLMPVGWWTSHGAAQGCPAPMDLDKLLPERDAE